jgi:serine protease Do
VAGYPFGMEVSSSVKVTSGIISSLAGLQDNFSRIQIDAALQPGNSGGPIIDLKGNIVGVAVAKLDLKAVFEAFGVVPEGTNFGVKTSVLGDMLDSLGIDKKVPNKENIPKSQIAKQIEQGTYYLSCWMTMAQIERLRTQKVIFENIK